MLTNALSLIFFSLLNQGAWTEPSPPGFFCLVTSGQVGSGYGRVWGWPQQVSDGMISVMPSNCLLPDSVLYFKYLSA